MIITVNTTLCPGTLSQTPVAGAPAIEISANNVTLTCAPASTPTIINGGGNWGTVAAPTIGIQVDADANVTIRNCVVSGFRYGLVATGATNLTIDSVNLSSNYSDPTQGDVLDANVQGGGARIEDVDGGSLSNSYLKRNWNGVELRHTSNFTVHLNTADHCSNAGAFVLQSSNCELSDNDFSYGIRGTSIGPGSISYGAATHDSAGIILDASSTNNRVLRNNATYGGDGIFVRSVEGLCPENNLVDGNDASYSPNNGIECTCDGNTIQNNTIAQSNYGIWGGGGDRAVIRSNTISNSHTDGISIQIAEDRHTLVEKNTITGSGRVGLLLSGRQYQSWDPLSNWASPPANSSQIVVQNNSFSGNGVYDLFTSSTRDLVLASNCGASSGPISYADGGETAVIKSVGSCNDGASSRTAPTAALAPISSAPTVNVPVTFDASGSKVSPNGGTLAYTWLIQPGGLIFPTGTLPAMISAGPGTSTRSVTFTSPGIYDVDVTVDDGYLASMAHQIVAAVPSGYRIGDLASDWTSWCQLTPCSTTFTDESNGIDGTQVHVYTDTGFEFAAITPKVQNLGLNASGYTKLSFFMRARNDNPFHWQGSWPEVWLVTGSGAYISYTPSTNLLPNSPSDWIYLEVPLAGGSGWTRSDNGGSLSSVNWVEFHADTWNFGFDLWFDAITFN